MFETLRLQFMNKIGEGGNSIVLSDGHRAYKRLKPNVGREAVVRFQREASLLMELRCEAELRIVPAHEIRDADGQLEIVMDLFSGSLEQVLGQFKGQPRKAAKALEPVAQTLTALAARRRAVHHRDIKPTNFLYRSSESDLWLADFGCAFIVGDERLTPDRRAMGAWAYRPPEYSNGRVEEVNEKGDVFSLGKVLWAMIYGEKGFVFPGAVWFTPDFDLGRAFPNTVGIHHAMLVISQACSIDPARRPTLIQLSASLRQLARAEPAADQVKRVEMLRAEALVEAEHAQRSAATSMFVRALHSDLHAAVAALHAREPDFLFWKEWRTAAQGTPQTADALVQQVAEQVSDAPVVNVRFRGRYLTTRFWPAAESKPARFGASIGVDSDAQGEAFLEVSNAPAGLTFESRNAEPFPANGRYSSGLLEQFLDCATQRIYSPDS